MQAWAIPPLDPPGEVRLQDNLQRKGFSAAHRDGESSATVEVIGRLDEEQRLQAFREWLHRDLQLAYRTPPPKLDAIRLSLFMSSDPTDPMKALLDQVRFTRSWYQAPLQVEAAERARAESLYR